MKNEALQIVGKRMISRLAAPLKRITGYGNSWKNKSYAERLSSLIQFNCFNPITCTQFLVDALKSVLG